MKHNLNMPQFQTHLAKLTQKTKSLLQCKREDISTLINALTDHCLLGSHARRLGLSNHDYHRSCKQVDEEESIEH